MYGLSIESIQTEVIERISILFRVMKRAIKEVLKKKEIKKLTLLDVSTITLTTFL